MAFHEFFEIDPKTGFLTPKPNTRIKNGVTAAQKVEFLKAFRASFNKGKAAKIAGISAVTLNDHLKGDSKFAAAYAETVEAICDDCEEALFAFVHKNPTAAFGILKAYRGKIWRERFVEKGPTKDERLKGLIQTLKEDDDGKK